MLDSVLDRLKRWWHRPVHGGYVDDDGPPRRLGCIDVRIYATPQDEADEVYLQQVQRLKSIQKQGRTPPIELQKYFADRFLERDIVQLTGCSFEMYLRRPLLVEHIRDERAAEEAGAPPGDGAPRAGTLRTE